MLKEQLLVKQELSLNVNALFNSDVEDATKDFALLDESDDEEDFSDI